MTKPAFRTPSDRYVLWPVVIEYCHAHPGWQLVFPDTPARLADTVRDRRNPQLRFEGGHLEAAVLNRHKLDGQERGDLYLRYVEG